MPLHHRQHAYQKGKSVETALHQLVVKIEKALDNKMFALGIFMDIEGAFDNTSYNSIKKAAQTHGIDTNLTRWIDAMLTGRKYRL